MQTVDQNDFAFVLLLYNLGFVICSFDFHRMTAAIGDLALIDWIFQNASDRPVREARKLRISTQIPCDILIIQFARNILEALPFLGI